MRRRGLIAGVATILAVGVVAAIVRHGGPPRRRPRVIPIALALALGFDWNPISWLEDVGHAIVRSWDDVKNFVYTVVGKAIRLVWAGLHDAIGAIDDALHAIDATFAKVWDWMLGEAGRVVGWIDAKLHEFWAWAAAVITGWVNDLRNWAQNAMDFIGRVLTDAINAVRAVVDGIYREFIAPLWHFLLTAADWFASMFAKAWAFLWDNVIKPEFDLLHNIYEKALQMWDWFVNELPAMWHVLTGAWHWLLWLADHSFGLLEALWSGDSQKINRAFLQRFAAIDHETLALIDDSIRQVFG